MSKASQKSLIDVKFPNGVHVSLRIESHIYNTLIQKHNMPICACCIRNSDQSPSGYRASAPKLFEDLVKQGTMEKSPKNDEEKYFLNLFHTKKPIKEYAVY